jgi:hypothetical protein
VSTSSDPLITSNAFVYPNPTNADLTITTTETSFSGNDRMWLYNTLGELLYVGSVNRQQTSIDLSAYPSGVYFLRADIGGVGETFRVVKE